MNQLLIAILITLSFTATSATAQKTKAVQKAVIQTTISCSHCKQCETCGGLLEQALLKKTGVQMITLDENAMTITVIYNSKKTSLPEIRIAISEMGYNADEIKATSAGYDKLDNCCKI